MMMELACVLPYTLVSFGIGGYGGGLRIRFNASARAVLKKSRSRLMTDEVKVIDAYRNPQALRPGCQHQLGCKCSPPYWLRPSSPQELAHEERIRSKLEIEGAL